MGFGECEINCISRVHCGRGDGRVMIPSPPHGSWISQLFTPSRGSESPHGSESQQPFTSFTPYKPSPKAPGHSSDLLRELHPRGQGGLIDPLPSYSHFQATCFLPEGPLATGQMRVIPLSVLTSAEHPQKRLPQSGSYIRVQVGVTSSNFESVSVWCVPPKAG